MRRLAVQRPARGRTLVAQAASLALHAAGIAVLLALANGAPGVPPPPPEMRVGMVFEEPAAAAPPIEQRAEPPPAPTPPPPPPEAVAPPEPVTPPEPAPVPPPPPEPMPEPAPKPPPPKPPRPSVARPQVPRPAVVRPPPPVSAPAVAVPPLATAPPLAAPPVSPVLAAPRLLGGMSGKCIAEYPTKLQQRGITGRVTIRVNVAAEGAPGAAHVQSSSGSAQLDAMALAAVRICRYFPKATEAYVADIPYNFMLAE